MYTTLKCSLCRAVEVPIKRDFIILLLAFIENDILVVYKTTYKRTLTKNILTNNIKNVKFLCMTDKVCKLTEGCFTLNITNIPRNIPTNKSLYFNNRRK